VDAQPDSTVQTADVLARLGEAPYLAPGPEGYPPAPAVWSSALSVGERAAFAMSIADGTIPGAKLAKWPPAGPLASESRDGQVDEISALLFGNTPSATTRALLESGGESSGMDRIVGLALGAPEFQRY